MCFSPLTWFWLVAQNVAIIDYNQKYCRWLLSQDIGLNAQNMSHVGSEVLNSVLKGNALFATFMLIHRNNSKRPSKKECKPWSFSAGSMTSLNLWYEFICGVVTTTQWHDHLCKPWHIRVMKNRKPFVTVSTSSLLKQLDPSTYFDTSMSHIINQMPRWH